MRTRLRNAGFPDGQVLVGTAQRIAAWLDQARRGDIDRLSAVCDFMGVNIYPFFTIGYDASRPLELLDAQWDQMLTRFPNARSKLRLTETGWPSAGEIPRGFPQNIPTPENQRTYLQAVARWTPSAAPGPHFWFMAYDRRADDPFLQFHQNNEQFFGIFTADNQDKGAL